MHNLYPEIQPYVSHTVAVEPPHKLHVEECGNPKGIPVLFVHGGPGAGCEDYHRRFFDPERYRIILFDQRGCGRSAPHAELEGNTTQALVADMEQIREHLGVDSWLLFGGSWGSTLSLVYAETHPERVLGLVLRGIFLCRPQEIQWFYQQGASHLFPDYWQDYLAPIPEAERGDMVSAYYRRLDGDNEMEQMVAAKAWSLWEGRTSTLRPSEAVVEHFANPYTALSLARIECHYFMHDSFLEPDQILRDAGRLSTIPGVIVHGRYDVVCPLENAWQLHQRWPDAELKVIADAGHSASEPGTINALIQATDDFAERLA
ncbi:MAG: prolyl aminopeptidase [Gammaproteobacteria bacterium]|nr:prolyl aminopeptidase [Gammaproteobacteria bacterium]MCW8839984.1 prolyl aminopeptidase [Gammaproteobacteria bacterium]MCW8927808.1 prolyl aminopeptidase [Gammaproteobacteria bacterium]MCW8958263.1 prolyl aminopeptidase [Gammaproteobacteria bacterium]MCW8972930.1 prolyl aminopeptidase [Gammaproteobacteria bacterium]